MILLLGAIGCMTPDLEPLSFERELVWADDFEGQEGSGVNPAFWTHQLGQSDEGWANGEVGWGNRELQYYTDRPENIQLNGEGFLQITALKESFEGASYTSARIMTQNLASFQYGRIEARIKIPAGQGLWPAFWMIGDSHSDIGWPACGEIDIMENKGNDPNRVLSTVHGPGYSAGDSIGETLVNFDAPFSDDFHVYSVDHAPDYLAFYVDDALVFQIQKGSLSPELDWVFNDSFFLLLNLAVGGDFVGSPLADSFPATLLVDYVRVYSHVE